MKIRVLALFIIAFIAGLSACKKNNDAPTVTATVDQSFINASTQPVNVYLNGSRLNSTSTIDTASFTKYYTVPAGQRAYQLKKQFNTATNSIQTLFSVTVPADNYFYHSLFITDSTVNNTFQVADTLGGLRFSSTGDTCAIRFVNSSPQLGGVDVSFAGVATFKNITFKSASPFAYLGPSTGTAGNLFLALTLYNTGTNTVLAKDSVGVNSGSAYTFYTVGKPGTTGFGIRVMQNL